MRIENMNRKEIIRLLKKEYPAQEYLYLKFGDCILSIGMNSHILKEYLSGYFRTFILPPFTPDIEPDIQITALEADSPDFVFNFRIKEPDPGKTKIKEAWVDLADGRIVRKRLTGMHFIFGQGDHLAVGPCVSNANQVINFINNRFIEWKLHQGGLLGHAAGVCLSGNGLAMAGFSGMGKSTLALHMLSLGVDFVSNDRLMILNSDQRLRMYGVAKQPRINPGTALNNENLKTLIPEAEKATYMSLSKESLWHLEQKYDAPVDAYFKGSRFILSAPMTGLFILNWQNQHSGSPIFKQVKIAKRRDLLGAFMKPTGLFYHSANGNTPKPPSEDEYIRLLKNCDIVEISGGVDFDTAARFGMKFLQQGGYPE